jgi:hypothetical protein
MTTIFKVSDQERVTPTFERMEASMVRSSAAEAADQQWPATLDEAGIADEMERVEKCASEGRDYVYSSEWPAAQVAQLREYAAVCSLKGKMIPAKQAKAEPRQPVEDADPDMRRLAEIAAKEQPKVSADLALAVGDPFHLTDKDDRPAEKDDWQRVAGERKLAASPQFSGGIAPIRGEYEYETSQTLRVRRGENSVADPDAIGKLAKELDSGEQLRQANEDRKTERDGARRMWEQEAIAKAKALGAGALPRGNTFMTASAPVPAPQSGIDLKAAIAEVAKTAPQVIPEIPDLTDGEKLRQANKDRRTVIQRAASKDDWQKVKGSTRPSLTDEFSDALEHQLKKAGIVKD